jgi:protein-S-isoprenylcysteine O-methyltransferase Ste14
VGIVLIISGISLIVLARREFAQHRQSMEPGHSISKIVQTSVFSISRNPLYLGIALTLAGGALALNVLWILVLLIPALMLCHWVLIAPEERYLKHKFGEEYLAYAAVVRRWLGRK